MIIVGIAIFVGTNTFYAQAASANLDAVINDLLTLAARAQQYYIKTISMGGGGNSFINLTIDELTPKPSNDNGTYSVEKVAKDKVVLGGTGVLYKSDEGKGKGKAVGIALGKGKAKGRKKSQAQVLMYVFIDSVNVVINK